MGRVIAIDYGTKRTGVAASDPLRIIASPLETVPTASLMEFLHGYIAAEPVDTIVVGKPLRMDGSPSDSFRHIEPFVGRLRREFPGVEVVYYDERFTSVLAHKAMIEGGVRKMDRRDKSMVDKISAAIILRDWLESRAAGRI